MKTVAKIMAVVFVFVSLFGTSTIQAATVKNQKNANYYKNASTNKKVGKYSNSKVLKNPKYNKGFISFSNEGKTYYLKLTNVSFSGKCQAILVKTTKILDSKLKVTGNSLSKGKKIVVSGLKKKGSKAYFKYGSSYIDALSLKINSFETPVVVASPTATPVVTKLPTTAPTSIVTIKPNATATTTATAIATTTTTATATATPGPSASPTATPNNSFESLESSHNYVSDYDHTWYYTDLDQTAKALKITFNASTQVEYGGDYIYIYDENGNNIPGSPYTGTQLSGVSVGVIGNSFSIQLVTDSKTNDYGFKVVAVDVAETCEVTLNANNNCENTTCVGVVGTLFVVNSYDIMKGNSVFAGWYKDEALKQEWDFNTDILTGDTILYAKWFDDYVYEKISESNISVTRYLTSDRNVIIPSMIDGYYVKTIGLDAFAFLDNVERIDVPSGVTSIADGSFAYCSNLRILVIPSSVKIIADTAFFGDDFLTIYGEAGSAAETYANANSIPFVDISSVPTVQPTEPVATPDVNLDYLQSAHKYSDNTDQTWEYTSPNENAEALLIKFDKYTYVESGTDFIHILDGNGDEIQGSPFTGSDLLDKTVGVVGSKFTIRLESDSSYNYYGFKVTNVDESYKCTVSFESNGGTYIEPLECVAGTKIIEPEMPTKGQAGFGGWYSDEELTTPWDFYSDRITSDVTLYAQWFESYAYDFIDDSNIYVYGYFGPDKDLVVPSTIDGYTVQIIGSVAFAQNNIVESIEFPSTVTKIYYYAMALCPSLKKVVIPDSVKFLGDNIFLNSPNVVIYGAKGSAAETYADTYEIPFVEMA